MIERMSQITFLQPQCFIAGLHWTTGKVRWGETPCTHVLLWDGGRTRSEETSELRSLNTAGFLQRTHQYPVPDAHIHWSDISWHGHQKRHPWPPLTAYSSAIIATGTSFHMAAPWTRWRNACRLKLAFVFSQASF